MSFCITNVNTVTVIDDGVSSTSCLTTKANNITITKGSTFNLIFDLSLTTTASDGTSSSNAADLTGYSLKASIKDTSTSTSEHLFMSTQNRMIVIDYTDARVSLSIPVKHTSRLPSGAKYYSIELIRADGNTQNIIQGIATIQ